MKKFIGAFTLCVLTAFGAAAQEKKEETSPISANIQNAAVNTPRGYVLGSGDEIEIKVFGEENLGGKYTVDENGKIEFEFIDQPIQAACKTEREVRADVTTALKKFLRNPQVNVRITERRSRPPAVIYGEVRNPQQIQMNRSVRLHELISFAGGVVGENASGSVQVFHTQPLQCPEPGETAQPLPGDDLNGTFEVYKLAEVRDGKNSANPIIRPGDVVVVPKAAPVYVVGEVRIPQEKILIPENGLSLTSAIAQYGGLTREARKKDVRIYRLKSAGTSERETIAVNLDLIKKGEQQDVMLQPYDVVEVEKAPMTVGKFMTNLLQRGAEAATNALPLRIVY